MLPEEIDDHDSTGRMAGCRSAGGKVMIRIPQKGMKEKLVELAAEECGTCVARQDKEKIKREEGRTIGAVKEIDRMAGSSGLTACGSV